MTHTEAGAVIGVSPSTLRRWLREGLVSAYRGAWTPSALGRARLAFGRVPLRFERLEPVSSRGFGTPAELFLAHGTAS